MGVGAALLAPDRRTVERWAWASVVANMVIVLTGGLVRLTGSGLGCPAWPRCTDQSFVPQQTRRGSEHLRLSAEIQGHRPLQLQQDRLQGQIELSVGRQPHDGGMKSPVGIILEQLIVIGLGLPHLVQPMAHVGQPFPVRGRVHRKRGFDRMPLQHSADAEKLVDIRRGQIGHPHPAPGQMLDQALLRQGSQRLA